MAKNKTQTALTADQIIKLLRDNGAPDIIIRRDVGKYSCGFVHPLTVRNADSRGYGPDQRMLLGSRKAVGYPIASLARYMAGRGFYFEEQVV